MPDSLNTNNMDYWTKHIEEDSQIKCTTLRSNDRTVSLAFVANHGTPVLSSAELQFASST